MFKSICIRRGATTAYLVVLIYFCVLVPFITPQGFYENYDYIIASTIGGSIFTLTSVAVNAFAFYVLIFRSNGKEPTNYLFALIAIFDLVLPVLYYPIKIADLWIYKSKLYESMDYQSFMDTTVQLAATHIGVATASVVTFTFICLLRFYQAFQKYGLGGIKTSLKVTSSLILVMTAVVVGLIDYHFVKEQWFYAFQATICMFFPLFVMAMCLLASFIITERSISYTEGNNGRLLATYVFFLLYFLLWTPSFTLNMMHRYCCTFDWYEKERARVIVENVFHLKTCLNTFFLYVFDDQFRCTSNNTLKCLKWGRKKVTFTRTVNDEDITIRYSPNHNSVSFGIDDEQALING